jgi:hypothetical protein
MVSNVLCVTANLQIPSSSHKIKFYARLLINRTYQYQENTIISSIPGDFYNPLDLL